MRQQLYRRSFGTSHTTPYYCVLDNTTYRPNAKGAEYAQKNSRPNENQLSAHRKTFPEYHAGDNVKTDVCKKHMVL